MVAPEYGGDNNKQAEAGKYPEPLVTFPAHWADEEIAASLNYARRRFGGVSSALTPGQVLAESGKAPKEQEEASKPADWD